jgi:flagellar biosynthesis/type III secretory pathway M-ring protein FliF/YscJ
MEKIMKKWNSWSRNKKAAVVIAVAIIVIAIIL